MATAAKTREILVVLAGGKRRLVKGIPSTAKITFGPVQPGTRDYGSGGNALRIYTTQNNQLAVFVGVQEFRDLSLEVLEEKVTRKGHEESEAGPKGSKRSGVHEELIEWEQA